MTFRTIVLAAVTTLWTISAANAATISNIVFTPDTPANLAYGDNVNFTFDYVIEAGDEPSTIFGRPVSGGSLTPAYVAHPSPTFAAGTSGSASGFFTIATGVGLTLVDQVVFRIFANNVTQTYELFVDTHFVFGEVSDVPLPAALPLFIAGLAGLGLTGRSRRKKAA